MAKTTLSTRITAGASVVVVRNGKRKVIPANSPDAFTDDEIRSVNSAVPGALRAPINEVAPAPVEEDEDEDLDLDADESEDEDAPSKTAKAAKAKSGKSGKSKAKDASEDEDI